MTQGNEPATLLGCVYGDQGSGTLSMGQWLPGGKKEHQVQIRLPVGEISKMR